MSNLSEEEMRTEENLEHEVIDRLKTLESMDFDYNALDASYVDAMLKARNIILDLYNKEKEKNKRGIKALEILRQEFSEDLQPDFIYIREILKGEIKCKY